VAGLFLPRGADALIAQVGITKSGGAWLPFDAETPLERVAKCLQVAGAVGLVSTREWIPRLTGLPVPVWAVEDLAAERPAPLPAPAAQPDDLAYVIFTSGSTGEPKGIAISHRSICHLLRSENEVLGVRESDRVYQGFSLAFDMSFEEIWISWLVGAAVWIAPPSLTADAELIAEALNRERITVLHAVPTLMGLINDPLPGLRIINLGGEACPEALAQRLVGPSRRVFNSYGPTETTVSATFAELRPGEPVTIGYPLPNYALLVVDEQCRPLPAGETGELCIVGPGLASGYLNRPELTAKSFVPNPLAVGAEDAVMYRTGDLGRLGPNGPAHCLGRVDNQVKIRGFRVELDEISAALANQPGVAAAAVVVRPIGDVDQIVGFAVPASGPTVDAAELRHALSKRLPPYMVPSHVELVDELPRLSSGKVNARALRELPLHVQASPSSARPRTPEEAALYAALEKLLPGSAVQPEADFFEDLGGHSLIAARLVSMLRRDGRYARLSVHDIYRERRLSGIAQAMARVQADNATAEPVAERVAVSPRRHFLCGLAQAVVIPMFVMLHIADWLAPFFVYHYHTGDPGDSIPLAILWSLSAFILAEIAKFVVAIAGKRLLAGRLRPGVYPLWGLAYFRWWLAGRFTELPDVHLLASTPWMGLYLRALGARVGRDVVVDVVSMSVPELVTIGDGASIGSVVNLENARVEGGQLRVGAIAIGRDAVVESSAVLEDDTLVGDGARLKGQSALAAGRTIPPGEVWEGSPARPVGRGNASVPPPKPVSSARRGLMAIGYAVTALAVSVLFFLPTFPAFLLIDWIDANTVDIVSYRLHPLLAFGAIFLIAIPASAVFVGLTLLVAATLNRLLPRQQAGTFSIDSFAFWRKRLTSLVVESSLRSLHGLYASVYAAPWLRLLGARVGRHAEVSTAEGMVPQLLQLGDDSFIADGAILGDEEVTGGWMTLQATSIGNRSFIGNGAYVPDGAVIPEDVLIGVQSKAAPNDDLSPGQTWLGSPAILLPAREQLHGFEESLTFRPSAARQLARGIVEALRILLPLALVIAAGYLIVVLVMPLAEKDDWGREVPFALAIAGCLFGLASYLVVVLLKWLLIGHYRPSARPMWTPFVWRSEAITNLYESLAVPNLLNTLLGTPMLPWALALLGVRIGRRVWLNTTDITEFDCVSIGDEAELNAFCGPQTHLFEDRIMKIGRVVIGARVTVGARTIILYDTQVGDGARLGPLTLVAKGEHLPAATAWEGSPAAPLRSR
jgi:non-ribosomal peptide synthetase-like protein